MKYTYRLTSEHDTLMSATTIQSIHTKLKEMLGTQVMDAFKLDTAKDSTVLEFTTSAVQLTIEDNLTTIRPAMAIMFKDYKFVVVGITAQSG